MSSLKKIFAAAALSFGMLLTTSTGLMAQDTSPELDELTQDDQRQIQSLTALFNFVSENHYKNPTVQELIDEAIECAPNTMTEWEIFNCVLQKLDPHSRYMDPNQARDFWERVQGQFGGVGVMIMYDDVRGGFVVRGFSDNSPSEQAGLQEGDVITHIDGQDVTEDGRSSIQLLRGDIGSDVTMTVRRPGAQQPLNITVTRAAIEQNPVTSRQIGDNIGYVRLSDFMNGNSQEKLKDAVETHMTNMGDDFDGLILDLRGNPGGLLSEAIDIVDDFIDDGVIVSEGSDPANPDAVHRATDGDILGGKRLIVLTDGGSASASEVVSGALQDHGRATILGTQTFGKGSVQGVYNLTNGGAIRLTTYLYFLPTGRSIQGQGITPDIEHISSDSTHTGKRRTESGLAGTIANPNAVQDQRPSQTCETEDGLDASQLEASLLDAAGNPDEALICAVELMNNVETLSDREPANDADEPSEQRQVPRQKRQP